MRHTQGQISCFHLYAMLAALGVLGACSSSNPPTPGGGAGAGSLGGAGTQGNQAGSAAGSAGNGSGISSPTFIPMFPGAGTGNASDPLIGGMICDYVPHAGEKGADNPLTECFFEPGKTAPAATLEQVLECVDGKDAVHLRLTFDPAFVDNTYGANQIGWDARAAAKPPKMGKMARPPHSWKDLVGSDHAQFLVTNGAGDEVIDFKLDYISEDPSVPSGYASLGVSGGDGEVISGDASAIVDFNTSIARNFNERGYGSYTVDSPATDTSYTPNAAAPDWDFRVVYEVWIDIAAFGASGFGDASIASVHASPSKFPDNTIVVEPGPCPPDWCTNPDGCDGGPRRGDAGVACIAEDPDDFHCYDGGVPPPVDAGSPCVLPDDPACSAD